MLAGCWPHAARTRAVVIAAAKRARKGCILWAPRWGGKDIGTDATKVTVSIRDPPESTTAIVAICRHCHSRSWHTPQSRTNPALTLASRLWVCSWGSRCTHPGRGRNRHADPASRASNPIGSSAASHRTRPRRGTILHRAVSASTAAVRHAVRTGNKNRCGGCPAAPPREERTARTPASRGAGLREIQVSLSAVLGDVRKRELELDACARWGCRWSKIAGEPVRLKRALIRRGATDPSGSLHPWPSTISPVGKLPPPGQEHTLGRAA